MSKLKVIVMVLIVSVVGNLLLGAQLYLKSEKHTKDDFDGLYNNMIEVIEMIDGNHGMTSEVAIKNAISNVERFEALRLDSEYKKNTELSSILHLTLRFLVMSSEAYITENLDDFVEQLKLGQGNIDSRSIMKSVNESIYDIVVLQK